MTSKLNGRLPYETPELAPITTPFQGRAPSDARRPAAMPEVAGVRVNELVRQHNSPLCVIDEDALRRAYRGIDAAFRDRWPRTRIGYSVKTNYLSAIVAVLREEGALGEAVSGFEYALCRDLGIPGEEIIFNGPWKTDDELRRAFQEKAHVNLDGNDELERARRVARLLDGPCGVGLRVNVRLNYPPWDKFGFGLESGDALEAARILARDPALRLEGLHLHVGTYVPDTSIYARGMQQLVDFGTKLERELGLTIRYLDIGGGYASRNTLHGSLQTGDATAPTAEEYAEAITTPLRMAASGFKAPPSLYLEPGRALVDEAASMITTVRAVKRSSGAAKAAVLDVGVHLLPTAFWYRHEIRPVGDRGQALETYRLVGPLCMQIDVLREAIELPALRRDDLLVIRDVGAYNFSQSLQFIHLRPRYVLVTAGRVSIIRDRETLETARALERLPAHLVNDETRGSGLAGVRSDGPTADSRRALSIG